MGPWSDSLQLQAAAPAAASLWFGGCVVWRPPQLHTMLQQTRRAAGSRTTDRSASQEAAANQCVVHCVQHGCPRSASFSLDGQSNVQCIKEQGQRQSWRCRRRAQRTSPSALTRSSTDSVSRLSLGSKP